MIVFNRILLLAAFAALLTTSLATKGTLIVQDICPVNEHYSFCIGNCESQCATLGEPCSLDSEFCLEGCVCNDGYARDQNGICIPKEKCEVLIPPCPKYEHLSDCAPLSQPTCGIQETSDISRLRTPCSEGCVCDEGYIRDASSGACIPIEKCNENENPCGVNAYWTSCGPNCDRECATLGQPCTVNYVKCPEGCYCLEGYARDANRNCVPIEKCQNTTEPICPINEYWSTCGPHCGQSCDSLERPCDELPDSMCSEGCFCKEGYARDASGACVPQDKCETIIVEPHLCPEHEFWAECGPLCHQECSALDVNCELVRFKCVTGCFCEEGYARDANGICIPKEKCEVVGSICSEHEHWTTCAPLCQETCGTDIITCGMLSRGPLCREACVCDEGYIRDASSGACIPIDKCNENQCGENAYWTSCGPNCDTECATLGQPCTVNYVKCPVGCYCQKGYARDENRNCVPIEKCQNTTEPTCPINEYWSKCVPHCRQNCDSLHRPCDELPESMCSEGCVCKEGYARDASGTCIPIDKCEVTECPVNEYWSDCGPVCQDLCSTVGVPCDNLQYLVCPKGCFCQEGYARDDNGICIPIEKCPNTTEPTCPINEYWSTCGPHCGQSCDSFERPCDELPDSMCSEGCFCKEGYARDASGTCVPKDKCETIIVEPVLCPEHEFWAECGPLCHQECSALDVNCELVRFKCVTGCFCEEGYARNANGICIPKEKCKVVRSIDPIITSLLP